MNTTPVWVLGFSVKDVLVLYIDDGSYFEADDLKDTFVRQCVISITAGLFFFDPKFCSRTRTLTTSMTTLNYLNLMALAIITALGVRAKWQLGKTMHAVLVLHTTRKLLVSVF